jgi:hypothetical protein
MTSDPADGFLVATAQILDLTLVTTDQQLLGLGKIKNPSQPLTTQRAAVLSFRTSLLD